MGWTVIRSRKTGSPKALRTKKGRKGEAKSEQSKDVPSDNVVETKSDKIAVSPSSMPNLGPKKIAKKNTKGIRKISKQIGAKQAAKEGLNSLNSPSSASTSEKEDSGADSEEYGDAPAVPPPASKNGTPGEVEGQTSSKEGESEEDSGEESGEESESEDASQPKVSQEASGSPDGDSDRDSGEDSDSGAAGSEQEPENIPDAGSKSEVNANATALTEPEEGKDESAADDGQSDSEEDDGELDTTLLNSDNDKPSKSPSESVKKRSASNIETDAPEKKRHHGNVDEDNIENKLYVGNLPFSCTESDIYDMFSSCGAIKDLYLPQDPHSRNNNIRGFAYIKFEDEKGAANALTLDGNSLKGRNLRINAATPKSKNHYTPNSGMTRGSSHRGRGGFRGGRGGFRGRGRGGRGGRGAFRGRDRD